FAAERGWRLDVISVHPSALGKVDNSRLKELPPGTRVFGVPMPELAVERVERFLWRCYRWLRPTRADAQQVSAISVPAHATAGPMIESATSEGKRDRLFRRIGELVGVARRGYFAWMDYHVHTEWANEVARLGQRLLQSEKYDAIITCGPPHMAHEAGRRL